MTKRKSTLISTLCSFFLILFILSACKDEGLPPSANELLGTWVSETIHYSVTRDEKVLQDELVETDEFVIRFNEDFTGEMILEGETFTYSKDGGVLVLTFTNPDGSTVNEQLQIREVSTTRLVLLYTQAGTNGSGNNYTDIRTFTLKKQ